MKSYTDLWLRRWRLTVLLMILCGVAGYAAARVLPQQVSASGALSLSIDYHQTGTLSELQEDRMLGMAEDVLKSDAVIDTVCTLLPDCDRAAFLERISLARTNDRWILSASGTDANETRNFVTTWLSAARAALVQFQRKAQQIAALTNRLDTLAACFTASADTLGTFGCPAAPMAILAEMDAVSAALTAVGTEAHGVSPALVIGALDTASISVTTNQLTQGVLTLIGALIGLLLSLILVFGTDLPELSKKAPPAES